MTRALLAALVLTAACDTTVAPTGDDVVARFDVSGLGELSGVAVQPDTGERLVLAADHLYVLEADGTTTRMQVQPGLFGFTDVIGLGDGLVALSAQSDGYLFDTGTGVLQRHFCYEPGEVWIEEFQITYSLAFDPDRELIIAQPQTAANDDPDTPLGAFVSTYDLTTGQDLEWFGMPRADYSAGGMIVPEAGQVWLGVGSRLDLFGFGASEPTTFARMGRLDVDEIGGLAIDTEADTLLVADAAAVEVVEIRLDALR